VRWLFLAFVGVPLVELYLLLQVGELLGPGPTVGIVVLTGVVGGMLAKREGLRVYAEWKGAIERGQVPRVGVIEGLLVLVGGALLITPGVLTDITGFCLLLPPTRRRVALHLRHVVERRLVRRR
jgi:UPF0716 protein FxsA